MTLVISNRLIKPDIPTVLEDIQDRVFPKRLFSTVEDKGDYYRVTCPFHKNGQEHKPSCSIYKRDDNDKVVWGTCHCFTCGYKAQFNQMVADCLEISKEEADDFLIENYSDIVYDSVELLPSIELSDSSSIEEDSSSEIQFTQADIDQYKYFHPYMFQRKLTEEVIRKFSIGYDESCDSIVFPVWDASGKLVAFTKRSVSGKTFQLQANTEKPIYLLNFLLKENHKIAYICESQFNALTLWTYGLPGVALFGTGSDYQYDILNKSGIRTFILCFDGDEAGRKGATRFKKNINKDSLVIDVRMPYGKDVNDISKEEFFDLLQKAYSM